MISKQAYIKYTPGHKNSAGESAPWTVRKHETEEIISSHKTKEEAEAHLRQMHMHSESFLTFREINKVAHCGPCTPMKMEAIRMLSDMHFELSNFDKKYLGQLATQSEEPSSNNFVQTLEEIIRSIEPSEKTEGKLRKLSQIATMLRDVQYRLDDGEFEADKPADTKKEANTVPYNGNKPADKEPDPSENEGTGYGGDREGIWGTPARGNQMKATANQDLGTIKKGDSVVITGSKKDKVFFYAEQDPTLVGIANKSLFTVHTSKKVDAIGFLKCHGALSKSPEFITKLASEFGKLVEPSVLDRLEEIKTNVATNRDRVMNQLPVSPTINANLRLADAAQYFTMRGVVPTEKDTIQYIKASMSAHTSLPEDNWSDEVVKIAMSSRKTAAAPIEWSDKLMLMQQWHSAGTLAQSIWEELLKLLDSNDLEEIRSGTEVLFNKASETVQKPETTTAAAIPPAPTNPPPAGKKYMWDAPSSQYVLVDASLKRKAGDSWDKLLALSQKQGDSRLDAAVTAFAEVLNGGFTQLVDNFGEEAPYYFNSAIEILHTLNTPEAAAAREAFTSAKRLASRHGYTTVTDNEENSLYDELEAVGSDDKYYAVADAVTKQLVEARPIQPTSSQEVPNTLKGN